MKKWFLMMAILCCTVIYADRPEKVEKLASKAILENTHGYFVLSDGSCWKAIPFSKRWRSLSEWWNNVQLVPESYDCVPDDWFLGTQIEIYSKHDNLEVDQANASNQDSLKQCTHMLINTRTGQVLFAIALEPHECIPNLFNDAHTDGYNKGYTQGRLKSYQNSTEIYNNGYSDGYKVGYRDGSRAGQGGGQQTQGG